MSGPGEVRFGWLHFSDLHQGHAEERLWPGIYQQIIDDLRKVHRVVGPWDVVLFTGDLVQGSPSPDDMDEQFARVTETLGAFWRFFERELGFSPALVTVPGNHDLRWQDPKGAAVLDLLRLSSDPQLRKRMWTEQGSAMRAVIDGAFDAYTRWESKHPFPRVPVTRGTLPGDGAHLLEKDGARLGIVGLNSAYVQVLGKDDVPLPILGAKKGASRREPYRGLLWLDVRQFHGSCGGDGPRWAEEEVDAALLLTHHPAEWLSPSGLQEFQQEIYTPGRFAGQLFGHMHETAVRSFSTGGSQSRYFWQGASLFGFENGPGPAKRCHGYTAGELISRPGGATSVRLWPRLAWLAGQDHWRFIQDPAIELDLDGGTEPIPVRRRRRSRTGSASDVRAQASLRTRRAIGEIGQKYLPGLYVERDIDGAVDLFLSSPGGQGVFLIVDKAGSGKTNTLCRIAEVHQEDRAVFLIRAKFSRGLLQDFLSMFQEAAGATLDGVAAAVETSPENAELLQESVVLIDGLNEYPDSSRALNDLHLLLETVVPRGVKVVATCRDLFWQRQDEEARGRIERSFSGGRWHGVGGFSDSGVIVAAGKYFAEYRIVGELKDRALQACKFPLLLRFFCVAHAGQTVGPLYDIRLAQLFKEYLDRKTKEISGALGRHSHLEITATLAELAWTLFNQRGQQLRYRDLGDASELCRKLLWDPELLRAVLDEGILQETEDDRSASQGATISFVYDELLEYLCARRVMDEAPSTASEFDSWLRRILRGESSGVLATSHVVEYMALLGHEGHHTEVLTGLLAAGRDWHPAIVRALLKIPAEELTPEELELLLRLARGAPDVSPDARPGAKALIAERYAYYGAARRAVIWAEVQKEWGDDQQIAFIGENFERLDAEKWTIMERCAQQEDGLAHDTLRLLIEKRRGDWSPEDRPRLCVILRALEKNGFGSVPAWAANEARTLSSRWNSGGTQ